MHMYIDRQTYFEKFCKNRSSLFCDLYGCLGTHEVSDELAVDVHELTLGKLE